LIYGQKFAKASAGHRTVERRGVPMGSNSGGATTDTDITCCNRLKMPKFLSSWISHSEAKINYSNAAELIGSIPARGTNKAVRARSKASATVRAVLGNP
jgi:hypothetical protein